MNTPLSLRTPQPARRGRRGAAPPPPRYAPAKCPRSVPPARGGAKPRDHTPHTVHSTHSTLSVLCVCMMMMFTPAPERHLPTSRQHWPAPSGTPPPSQPPPPPQTRRETQSHSAPTPLKRPMLTPEGEGPGPESALRQARGRWSVHKRSRCAYSTHWYHREIRPINNHTVPDVGLRSGFLPPRRAGVYLPLHPRR